MLQPYLTTPRCYRRKVDGNCWPLYPMITRLLSFPFVDIPSVRLRYSSACIRVTHLTLPFSRVSPLLLSRNVWEIEPRASTLLLLDARNFLKREKYPGECRQPVFVYLNNSCINYGHIRVRFFKRTFITILTRTFSALVYAIRFIIYYSVRMTYLLDFPVTNFLFDKLFQIRLCSLKFFTT